MSRLSLSCVRLAVVLVGLGAAAPGVAQLPASATSTRLDESFTSIGDFPLGAATSRTDYESFDATTGRLYIAKMGAGSLLAYDVRRNTLLAELPGFPKVTGVLVVAELGRLYASVPGAGLGNALSVALGMAGLASGHGAVAVLDTEPLRETSRLPGGVFPDGLAYDPRDGRLFVSDELGGAVLAYDAKTNRVLARIDTGGEVGNVRFDPVTQKVYAPVGAHDELVEIDPIGLRVSGRHKLRHGKHPHGLIIAPGAAIGYIACDGDDRLLTVDLPSGTVLTTATVGHDPDVLAIDPGLQRLYVASESGMLSIFDIRASAAPAPLGNVFVDDDAHTLAVDPGSHRLFFALADVDGRSVLRVLAPRL